MNVVRRGLIEYYGLDGNLNLDILNFKQFNQEHVVTLPIKRDGIDQIVSVWIDTKITETKKIKTSKGISFDGTILTGNKILVSGDIDLKIQYVASGESYGIHTITSKTAFCEYVVLPDIESNSIHIKASLIVEDLFSRKIDSRSIYNNITMVLVVDVY